MVYNTCLSAAPNTGLRQFLPVSSISCARVAFDYTNSGVSHYPIFGVELTLEELMQQRAVVFSFGSFVFTGLLVGLTGGFVFGAGFALVALLQGNWLEAIYAAPVAAIGGVLVCVLYAVLGYLPYRRLVQRYPQGSEVTGSFGPENGASSSN